MVAVFKGRGTIYGSLSTYQEGKGDSIISNINDLIDSVLSLHESGKTTVNTSIHRILGSTARESILAMWLLSATFCSRSFSLPQYYM